MKISKFEIEEESEGWSDPGVYPSGAGGSALSSHDEYMLDGYAIVEFDSKEAQMDPDDLSDKTYDFVKKEIRKEFGNEASQDILLKYKIVPGMKNVKIMVGSKYSYEKNESIKSLSNLIKELQ